jgi:hypothetical protein
MSGLMNLTGNHPRGCPRPARVGAGDAGENGRPGGGRNLRAGRDGENVAHAGARRAGANPGQHTDEVLGGLLGFDGTRLSALRQAKVIG